MRKLIIALFALISLSATAQIYKNSPWWFNDTLGVSVTGTLKIKNGATAGYVLTSDAAGVASWQVPGGAFGWLTTGNPGTNPSINFIGTTDLHQFRIRCNNYQAMQFKPNAGIEINLLDTSGVSMFRCYSDGIGSSFATSIGDWGNHYNGIYITVDNPTKTIIAHDSIFQNNGKWQLIDGTQAAGYNLQSDANGLASWQLTGFISSDSATIYATSPSAGKVYWCTNCTGNGLLGHNVQWTGTLWRQGLK